MDRRERRSDVRDIPTADRREREFGGAFSLQIERRERLEGHLHCR